jgi:hypothetical protein
LPAIDLSARVLAIRDGARARAESDRERNRREMPETARILDDVRATFGIPQWMRFTEAGRTVEHGSALDYSRAVQASTHIKRGKR